MSCSHEHHGHGHHGHDHHHDDDSHIHPDESPSDLLYSCIARDQITCLNNDPSSSTGSPSCIVKPWHKRNDEAEYIQSEADDGQLLIRIPFEGGGGGGGGGSSSCKLRSLLLKAGPGGHTPRSVTLFINQDPPLDFSDDLEARSQLKPGSGGPAAPAQKLDSIADTRDVAEYPLRVARFNNVRDITLFIDGAIGESSSRVYYLGFRGDGQVYHRQGPANLVYEATPQLKDHKKIPGTEAGSSNIGH